MRSRSMINPYDLKAVQEVVLWGLPDVPASGIAAGDVAAGTAAAIATDPVSQLPSATVRVHPALQTVPTPDGRLYVTNGGVDQAVHPYPILPAAVLDVPAGAGPRGARCRAAVVDARHARRDGGQRTQRVRIRQRDGG